MVAQNDKKKEIRLISTIERFKIEFSQFSLSQGAITGRPNENIRSEVKSTGYKKKKNKNC